MTRPPSLAANPTVCCACRQQRATNHHHRLPRSRGGPDDPFNVVPVCGSGTTGCHGRIEHNPEWARSRRLTIAGSFRKSEAGCCRVYVGPDAVYAEHYNRGGHGVGCPTLKED
ncbi:MAG: hypothetical protein R3324_17785 [Halobacteriales archaeon]|nr:hypothetical protein [Halobacteriales archaeon]